MDVPVPVPGRVPVAVPLRVRVRVPVAVAGLVDVACATRTRLPISHDTQDARNIRLQHLDNSYRGATANHPQVHGQLNA